MASLFLAGAQIALNSFVQTLRVAKTDLSSLTTVQDKLQAVFNSRRTIPTETLKYIGELNNLVQTMQTQGMPKADIDRVKEHIELVRKRIPLEHMSAALEEAKSGHLKRGWEYARQVYAEYTKVSQNLIDANASLVYRRQLLIDTLDVSGRTGVSFDKVTQAAKALVNYGMDNSRTWRSNLETIVAMERGLGLSVDKAAQLAAIVENRLGQGFKEAADLVARLVDKTSLNAEEAQELVQQIGRASSLLGNATGQYREVSEVIGKTESALKEVGVPVGALRDILIRMGTTPQGMAAGGIIGSYGGELLKSGANVRKAIGNLRDVLMQMDKLDATSRTITLQVYAQIFGTTADNLAAMAVGLRKTSDTLDARTTVESRFRNQMQATSQTAGQLAEQFNTLVYKGFEPIIFVVNKLLTVLLEWVTAFNDSPISKPIMAALATTAALGGLASFGKLAFSVAGNLARAGASLGFIGKTAALPGGVIGVGVAGVAAGASLAAISWVLYKWYDLYKTNEENKEIQMLVTQKEADELARKQVRAEAAIVSGNVEEMANALYGRLKDGMRGGGYLEAYRKSENLDPSKPDDMAKVQARLDQMIEPFVKNYKETAVLRTLSTDPPGGDLKAVAREIVLMREGIAQASKDYLNFLERNGREMQRRAEEAKANEKAALVESTLDGALLKAWNETPAQKQQITLFGLPFALPQSYHP